MSNTARDQAEIREALAAFDRGPGVAKAREARDIYRCDVHAAIVAAIDHLLIQPGWSVRRLAREVGCDHVALGDWLKRGDDRSSQWPAWILRALPIESRVVFMRHVLAWGANDNLAREGTNG